MKKIRKWMRIIHRDLGYLMVGITLVYGVSGMLLNHMNGKDPAYKSSEVEMVIEKHLNLEELKSIWSNKDNFPKVRKMNKIDDEHIRTLLDGGIGVYNQATGELVYETHEKRVLIYWINKLHYNRITGWAWIGDFFAASLIFFAISGLLMVPGEKGVLGRGKWYVMIGILIPILYLWLG